MKYFSLFENATCIKNRLDQAVVNFLRSEMSNQLIDERYIPQYEKDICDVILEACKDFPKCTPIYLKCYDKGGMNGVRRYSLRYGPNITFALHPVREDYSADIKEESK